MFAIVSRIVILSRKYSRAPRVSEMSAAPHHRAHPAARAAFAPTLRFLCAVAIAVPALGFAQTSPDSVARKSPTTTLAPVSITVTRDAARTALELPYAATRLAFDNGRPAQRRLSFSELLFGVAGVQVQDRGNPSQDPRLAIRGFGARSAFGVRGVRIMRDGIPLTLPDGQTPVDWLDLESVGSAELVRGTAAALYGNAAGGVVDFRSRTPATDIAALDARAWNGGGLHRFNVTASGSARGVQKLSRRSSSPAPPASASTSASVASRYTNSFDSSGTLGIHDVGWLGSFTRTDGHGARQWSQLDASSAFARSFATVAATRVEVQGSYYDAPRAENTGALNGDELARDPTLADSLNITKRSRKAVQHLQLALIVSRTAGAIDATASLFGGHRSLDNPLPFAIVGVQRGVFGGSARLGVRTTRLGWPVRFTVGTDAQQQRDNRVNYENCADLLPTAALSARCPTRGNERGALKLDQREQVSGLGVYARAEAEVPHNVFVSAALRADRVAFRVQDHFITGTNADDSGDRTLSANSPMLGIVWRARPLLSFYANIATAFETPTITELTNQENGAAGLNTTLAPQRTRTIESGMTAFVGGRAKFELAGFHARVQDELVPFDVPNQPGRRAYRNAGQTTRIGIESSAQLLLPFGEAGVAYTWSKFRFDRYIVGPASYAGKAIPGAPEHALQGWTTLRWQGWFTTAEVTANSRVSANDAATVFAPGYTTWNLKVGYVTMGRVAHMSFEPVVGVDNAFDRHFATSVIVNATRNRYFEPGLVRRMYFALHTQLH